MKGIKKTITVFIIISMMCGMLTVCASANSTKDPFPIELPDYSGKPYEFYTFLGDSVPAGGALWYDYSGKDIGEYGFMRINWSFPDFLAETINENYTGGWDTSGFHNDMGLAWSDNIGAYGLRGTRVGDVRMLIEKGCKEDYYQMNDSYSTDIFVPMYLQPTIDLYGAFGINKYKEIQQSLVKSDLITLTVGSNDIFTVPLVKMILAGKIDLTKAIELPQLAEVNCVEDALDNIVALYQYIAQSKELLNEFFSLVSQGVNDIKENYPALLADIQEINGGKADVIVMGIYNPFTGVRITEGDTDTRLTDMLSFFTSAVNEILIKACNEYPNVYYVDTDGVETHLMETGATISDPDFGTRMLKDIHPTIKGHLDLTQRIVTVLNSINECKHEHMFVKSETKAFFGMSGYTGDTYCSDCGKLLKSGEITTYTGENIWIPRATMAKAIAAIRDLMQIIMSYLPILR